MEVATRFTTFHKRPYPRHGLHSKLAIQHPVALRRQVTGQNQLDCKVTMRTYPFKVLNTATTIVALIVSLTVTACAVHAETCPASRTSPGRALAHPVVEGAAGPFPHVTLALTRPANAPEAPFAGTLQITPTTCLPLAGPDEPADFFQIDVKAVLFTRLGKDAANGIVVLYDSSQIGPDNGTDHEALVYRVDAQTATRQPELEKLLLGASNAAQARARLATAGAQ